MSSIRHKLGKVIALTVTISMFVGYEAHLLPSEDFSMLLICCAVIYLCGYFYDKNQKLVESLDNLRARSRNLESSHVTHMNHSIAAVGKQTNTHNQRLLSVIEDTSDCVGIAELSGRYVYMNSSFRNVLELEDEYPNDIYMFEWHSENNRSMLLDTALPAAVKDGVWTGESTLLTKTGKEIPVVVTISAHNDREGRMIEFYSTVIRESSTIQAEEKTKLSRLLLQRTMQVQENARHKLAQELHDGLGQSLYSIMLGLQFLQGITEGDRNKQLTQQWIDELHKVLSIVKLFAFNLRPHTLDQLGLSPAIEQLIAGVRGFDSMIKLSYETNMAFNQRFSEEIETCLYRLSQEALHNALKHAHANNIHISLVHNDNSVKLFVKDDGTGFLSEQKQKGLGLRHMEERTFELRGAITIESIIDVGTTINVEIPLEGK